MMAYLKSIQRVSFSTKTFSHTVAYLGGSLEIQESDGPEMAELWCCLKVGRGSFQFSFYVVSVLEFDGTKTAAWAIELGMV